MQMPIFWRLLSGYATIFLLSAGLSAYSIIELGGLSTTARSALETDTQRIATVESLTDGFLSEVRYAGRFVITHAKEMLDQYRQFNGDYKRFMNDLQALPASVEIQSRLARIADLHLRYSDLFEREVRYIQSAQPYGESRYQQEKEKVLESALRELEQLKTYSQKSLQTKLREMERSAGRSRTLAIATALVLVGLGFALCYKISKSITAPLLALQRSTTAQAEHYVDTATSDNSRIPEIQNLSKTLHQAKDHLRAAHESNAAFVHKISAEFATPLISLKNRLSYLSATLGETATPEQRMILVVLAEETERLIQGCTRLQVPTPPAITNPRTQSALHTPLTPVPGATCSQRAFSLLTRMGGGSLIRSRQTVRDEKSHDKNRA